MGEIDKMDPGTGNSRFYLSSINPFYEEMFPLCLYLPAGRARNIPGCGVRPKD
jgi:hypothetical protein